jgi:hypothetical protein
MPRILRIAVAVLALSAIAPLSATAATVPGCANPTDSAFNQYCETIPSSAGGQTPGPGLPTLGGALPAGVAKQLAAKRLTGPGRALLTMPAPARPGVNDSRAAVSTASTSSLPGWLIIVLIVSALTLGAAAAARWRRRHPSSPDDGATA